MEIPHCHRFNKCLLSNSLGPRSIVESLLLFVEFRVRNRTGGTDVWIWSQVLLSATPHCISALASCANPLEYPCNKIIYGCIQSPCMYCLRLFDTGPPWWCNWLTTTNGMMSYTMPSTKLTKAPSTCCSITHPRPCDQLWIVTDRVYESLG